MSVVFADSKIRPNYSKSHPIEGFEIKIRFVTGELVDYKCSESSLCEGDLRLSQPPSSNLGPHLMGMVASVIRRMTGSENLQNFASFASRGERLDEAVVTINGSSTAVDLGPALSSISRAEPVFFKVVPIDAEGRAETSPDELDAIEVAPGKGAESAIPNLREGLYRIELFAKRSGRLEPAGSSAWVLALRGNAAEQARARFGKLREEALAFSQQDGASLMITYLRAALVELSMERR